VRYGLAFARACLAFVAALCVAPSGLVAKKKPPEKPVNISTATSAESQRAPRIGPKRLAKMRKYLTLGQASESRSKGAPQGSAGSKALHEVPLD
jgi:hypothetical protein